MIYKAKDSYKKLDNTKNFVALGCASKHQWLVEGQQINYNQKLPSELKKHLDEVSEDKGAK